MKTTIICQFIQIREQVSSIFLSAKKTGTENKISVYNYLGELALPEDLMYSESYIDLSDQPKGIYFVHINSEKNSYIEKIILN